MDLIRSHVMVCGGTNCSSSASGEIIREFERQIAEKGLEKEIKVVRTGCFGMCEAGPVVIVYPEGAFYARMTVENVTRIVDEHLVKGRVVKELLYKEAVDEDNKVKSLDSVEFYKKQRRVALRNCGVIDPENIDEYIAFDGYKALGKVLTEMTPQEVIDVMLKSGLRGRGGAGFPTGMKWKFAAASQSDKKYVCCNADEGDPGAFMDEGIMEGNPHSILEGMMIAAIAVGAGSGYIYVRAEYPLAVERLQTAIDQARDVGLLGENILGTEFPFDIRINRGAGAFVCGEGSALTASIEGNRGMPRTKPPRTVEKGLWAKPTVLNNVETFANIPYIINEGANAYRAIGNATSPGTKAFALAGNIRHTGLIEVPMGTTLREIIFDIGGGIKDGKKFKAVQIGGPSGGCLTEEHLDLPLDYDSLKHVGAIMGSGGLVVMDEDTCMAEVARFFMKFTQKESCGKCIPCREGTKRMLEALERIVGNEGSEEDIELLEELSDTISHTALCGLGQSACKPVQSTLRYFREDYERHVRDKFCPLCNGKPKVLQIDPEKCKGCSLCARNCPVEAITGEVKKPFVIDTKKCIRCNACVKNCKFGAIREV